MVGFYFCTDHSRRGEQIDFSKLLSAARSQGLLSEPIPSVPSRGQASQAVPNPESAASSASSDRLTSSQLTSQGAESIISEEVGSNRKKEQRGKKIKKKRIPQVIIEEEDEENESERIAHEARIKHRADRPEFARVSEVPPTSAEDLTALQVQRLISSEVPSVPQP